MLALDSTIGCIEASESDIVELYRSAPITRSSSPDSRPESMEAYLCAIKKKPQQVKVYLTFVVNDRKIYVYTSPGKGKSDQEYPEEVEEALDCAGAMGFSLDRVDLSYSPAMREVVVRNTKILRLPGTKPSGALKHGLAGAPVLPLSRNESPEQPDKAASSPSALPSTAPNHTPTATEKSKKGGPGDAVELKKALAESKQERQALLAERDALAHQLRQVSGQRDATASELAALKENHAKLAAERETLLPFRKQVDELLPARDAQIARLQEQVTELAGKLQGAAGERADLVREHVATAENLAQARQEIARLAAERDSERERAGLAEKRHREAAAQLDGIREEATGAKSDAEGLSRRAGELEERNKSLERELAGLRQELDRIGAERDAASGRAAALEEQKEPADSELAGLREEVTRVAAERDAALQRAAMLEERMEPTESAPDDLGQELERVSAERDAALERIEALRREQGDAEAELVALRRELEERRAELAEERRKAAVSEAVEPAPSPALQQEGEQFPQRILQGLQQSAFEERPAFTESSFPAFHDLDEQREERDWNTSEPAQLGSPSAAVEFPPMGEAASYFVPLGDLQSGFFSGEDEGAPVRFLLESGLTGIDCPSPDDVLELHHSINNAYLSPEGTGGQESCQGYICCVRDKEEKRVFAAIYGTKSHRTRVYLPEAQPRDDESYARTVRGAISFAEEVGLMMEPVPLEGDAGKREERLKRCPVLRLAEGK